MPIQDGTVTFEKRKIANTDNLSMPSGTEINLSTSLSTYTAPTDGWLFIWGRTADVNARATLSIVGRAQQTFCSFGSVNTFGGSAPVAKGETVHLGAQGNNVTIDRVIFHYAKSAI